MQFDLFKIFHEMDWMARGVTLALLLMGVASLGVFIERFIAFRRSQAHSRLFAAQAAKLLVAGSHGELLSAAEKLPSGHLPRIIASGLRIHLADDGAANREQTAELIRRELNRQYDDASMDLRRGLNVLASVGSVAPFVGLLGTVVGIIAAFGKISTTGSGGLGSVAGGISEALVVTALGLMIAIPSVLLFNNLSGRVERIQQGLSTAIGQFVDHIEFGGRTKTVRAPAKAVESAAPRGATTSDAQLA